MEMTKAMVMAILIVSAAMSSHCINAQEETCPEVVAYKIMLTPCLPYWTGPAGQPSSACCSVVARLNEYDDSILKRRSLCECFKSTVKELGANVAKAKQLLSLCHVQPLAPIDLNFDCNTIN